MSKGIIVANQIDKHGTAALDAISRAPLAPTTKAQYKKALVNYLKTGGKLTDAAELATYAERLPQSCRAFLKAAVRKFATSAMLGMKGQATPQNVEAVTAAVYRLEAVQDAIHVSKQKGSKAHQWLSAAEVRRLVGTAATLRDKVALGLLVGAGLRREEAVQLTFADVATMPKGGKIRTVLNVTGKGAKNRIVPISESLAADIATLGNELGAGRVLRNKTRDTTNSGATLSAVALFHIVASSGRAIGKELAPHDLRRTYAQLGYDAGVPLTQISILLGHSSVATTQRYLNLDVDLGATISDFVPY